MCCEEFINKLTLSRTKNNELYKTTIIILIVIYECIHAFVFYPLYITHYIYFFQSHIIFFVDIFIKNPTKG